MSYDPRNQTDRRNLASAIEAKLKECGFSLEPSKYLHSEKIYARHIKDGMFVLIYTSIDMNEVREVGADAIRVSGVYREGYDANPAILKPEYSQRGIVSETRVNRVGDIEDIVQRMYERMRDVWRKCNNLERCSVCGAPKFTSKNGNLVCAAICWNKRRD